MTKRKTNLSAGIKTTEKPSQDSMPAESVKQSCSDPHRLRSRWGQFFDGEDGQLSMTRLLCFLSFFPATYVLIANVKSEKIADILLWYLSAFVLSYIGGKGADLMGKKKE